MAVPILDRPLRPHFFAPARQRMLNHLGHTGTIASIPKIVYIDRQSTDRRLVASDHENLLELLHKLDETGAVETSHVLLEKLSPKQQVLAVADLTVGIGPTPSGGADIGR